VCVQCVLAIFKDLSTERVRGGMQPSLHCSYPISSFPWRSALPHDVSAEAQRRARLHRYKTSASVEARCLEHVGLDVVSHAGSLDDHVNVASFNASTYLISIVHRAPVIP
jgi:hypothetical protein